ncbi:hypothetical protein BXY58_2471 [Epilithonimonas arachidiradicis]|uniref:Uncharacterized protein n=1 Tax=Epilithonimonas arachidiradicis TaxID=1617282 RepID=A0A420D7M2_9FLAO|nr:hypothetical protein BXY58_2471 [Epilithonimonas arachidiradicis]
MTAEVCCNRIETIYYENQTSLDSLFDCHFYVYPTQEKFSNDQSRKVSGILRQTVYSPLTDDRLEI